MIALWGEILRATPASRLALKYRNYYGDAGIAGTWRDHFERLGLDQERLILLSGDDPLDDHLRAYGKVDIALDPFPFNGATTTFEALLMGVPVIALWGDGFVDRVAASMLTHIGRGELAAGSQRAYLDIARRLADDHARLVSMRGQLGIQLLTSRLCNGAGYARNVEAAYRDMWRAWCAKVAD